MKPSRVLLLALAVAAGSSAVLWGLRGPSLRMLAQQWQDRLATVPDGHARDLLNQVAQLGEEGIPVLVQALGSQRESVARAAKGVLLDELGSWETLAAAECSPKLGILAEALAERVDGFGPTARSDAVDLANRILRWPLDCEAVDRPAVISSCESVLRATAADRRWPQWASRSQRAGPAAAATRQRVADEDSMQTGVPIAGLGGVPGGGLPMETFPALGAPLDRPLSPRTADARLRQPRRLQGPSTARPIGPPQYPRRLRLRPHETPRPLDSSDARREERPGRIQAMGLHNDRAPSAAAPAGRPGRLAAVDVEELMRRLRGQSEATASEARSELLRRGFREVHIELARRLFDPDPQVRKELARALPGLAGVDAGEWLLRLSRDEDAGVRLVAIALVATSGDSRLLDEVQRVAQADTDPRIRRQAERIATRRQQAKTWRR